MEDFTNILIVGEANNGPEGIKKTNTLSPDLLFLDIQMPGCDGFEVLNGLDEIPVIIFCTAYSEFALKAFEINAVDYLLKPYSRQRFDQAVRKGLKLCDDKTEHSRQLTGLLNTLQNKIKYPERVYVNQRDRVVPLLTSTIQWLKADDDYVHLYTSDKSYLVTRTLTGLMEKLDPAVFIRVHRSYAVNQNFISEIAKSFKGKMVIKLPGKTEIPIGRTYLKELKEYFI